MSKYVQEQGFKGEQVCAGAGLEGEQMVVSGEAEHMVQIRIVLRLAGHVADDVL